MRSGRGHLLSSSPELALFTDRATINNSLFFPFDEGGKSVTCDGDNAREPLFGGKPQISSIRDRAWLKYGSAGRSIARDPPPIARSFPRKRSLSERKLSALGNERSVLPETSLSPPSRDDRARGASSSTRNGESEGNHREGIENASSAATCSIERQVGARPRCWMNNLQGSLIPSPARDASAKEKKRGRGCRDSPLSADGAAGVSEVSDA